MNPQNFFFDTRDHPFARDRARTSGSEKTREAKRLCSSMMSFSITSPLFKVPGQKVQGGGLFPPETKQNILPACILNAFPVFFYPVPLVTFP